jgi:iron complex outermembrane receptor protein
MKPVRIQPKPACATPRLLPAMFALLAGALALPGQTATNKPPVRLPEVVVTGKKEVAAPGAHTVPTAAQALEQIKSVPGGANIVKAEEFKTGRASTMKDALDYVPGVFVQPRFGSDEARIAIRGSGLQRTFHGRGLKLMLDGVPLNLADGGFDMQAVEPLSVEYLEVFRGANALRYGSTTLGGAINYVSPTGYTADLAQARAEYGSYGYARGQVSSGQVIGPADYYVSLTHNSQDGFRVNSKQSTQRVSSNFGWRFSDTVETRMFYTYVLTDSALPGSLTKAQLEADPRQANAANLAGNQRRDFELHRVASKTTFTLPNGSLELMAFASHKDLYHPIFQVIDQNSNDFGVDVRYRHTADVLGRRNEFTAGFSPTINYVNNAQYLNVAGSPGALTLQNDQRSQNLDFYCENRHWLNDKLSLVVGAQASWANRHVAGEIAVPPPVVTFNQEYLSLSPKLGFIYETSLEAQLFGNVSRSFEPPSISEMGNVTIGGVPTYVFREAQSAWTVELGTRGERGRFSWDLTAYHAWVEDELLAFAVPGAAPGVTSTVNASTTTHFGVEAGAAFRMIEGILHDGQGRDADAIVLRGNYLWSRFRFQDDGTYGNNQLPGIPEHYLRAELTYEHPNGLYFGPNIEYTPFKYPVDMAGTLFADPYALVGLKAGWRSKKGLNAFIEIRNLTDKRYAATTGVLTDSRLPGAVTAQFLPGDGRAIYTGIEWKW